TTLDSVGALSRVLGLSREAVTQPDVRVPWLLQPATGSGENELQLAELSKTLRIGFVYDPGFAYQFCIPPNPIVAALKLHAELNLYKMRNCRNIAGLERQVEPYAAPTDTTTGLPTLGAGGQLVIPGAVTLRPTPYRYEALIARSKELVQLAAQIEASM